MHEAAATAPLNPWSAAPPCWFGFSQPFYFPPLRLNSPHDIIKAQDETNQEPGRENLTLNILLRLKCLSASQELGCSHDINRGWDGMAFLQESG